MSASTSPQTARHLRTILNSGRSRKTPSSEQIDIVIDALNAGVADYHDHRRWHNEAGTEAARLFADDVTKKLNQLVSTIERRRRAIGKKDTRRVTLALPMPPNALFSVQAAAWLSPLRKWGAAALSEVVRLKSPNGRPRDEVRLMLECSVADALQRAGITATKSKNGAFARVLREIVYPAIGVTDRDSEHAVRAALEMLDTWQALPEWSRRLPRARKPHSKISS